jgi:putative addiction module component (TIGR02574 family)
MSDEVAEFLKEALAFPPEARAALADSLLASLDTNIDEDAEDVWKEEIRFRLQQIDNGSVSMIPWNEVRKSIWTKVQI